MAVEGRVGAIYPTEMLLAFFTAFGVVVGGAVIGSLATLLTTGSPLQTMNILAKSVKMWAIVVAMGGTFPAIKAIESGLWGGEVITLARQVAIIISGVIGAYCGYWIMMILTGGE